MCSTGRASFVAAMDFCRRRHGKATLVQRHTLEKRKGPHAWLVGGSKRSHTHEADPREMEGFHEADRREMEGWMKRRGGRKTPASVFFLGIERTVCFLRSDAISDEYRGRELDIEEGCLQVSESSTWYWSVIPLVNTEVIQTMELGRFEYEFTIWRPNTYIQMQL